MTDRLARTVQSLCICEFLWGSTQGPGGSLAGRLVDVSNSLFLTLFSCFPMISLLPSTSHFFSFSFFSSPSLLLLSLLLHFFSFLLLSSHLLFFFLLFFHSSSSFFYSFTSLLSSSLPFSFLNFTRVPCLPLSSSTSLFFNLSFPLPPFVIFTTFPPFFFLIFCCLPYPGSLLDLGLSSTDYVEVCPQSDLQNSSSSQTNLARNAQRENFAGMYLLIISFLISIDILIFYYFYYYYYY